MSVGLELFATAKGPLHFMGIGGAGMCALAELVARSGIQVTGCDLKVGESLDSLRQLGVAVDEGHDPAHIADAGALIYTAAVPEDHPEILAARKRGIPVLKRATALGAWVSRGRVVAVAGTHGKTSTAAMLADMLSTTELEPTSLVGGHVEGWGGNLRRGKDEIFIVEADEYDRSFLTLSPEIAVVTNLEADHLDIYGTFVELRNAFRHFLSGVSRRGRVVICGDDHGASTLIAGLGSRCYTYGLNAGAQLRGTEVEMTSSGTTLRVVEEGRDRGRLRLSVPGLHNVRNALGAAGAARSLGVEWDAIRDGLGRYQGVGRRFHIHGEYDGVLLIDDYAHHPTEVEVTLRTVRELHPDRRLVAVFQPHLYTRTRDFKEEFGSALSAADVQWITDIFPAREEPLPGVTGELVADAVMGGEVHYHADLETLPVALASTLREGDLCVTMGAGSIDRVPSQLRALLEEASRG